MCVESRNRVALPWSAFLRSATGSKHARIEIGSQALPLPTANHTGQIIARGILTAPLVFLPNRGRRAESVAGAPGTRARCEFPCLLLPAASSRAAMTFLLLRFYLCIDDVSRMDHFLLLFDYSLQGSDSVRTQEPALM